VKPGISGLAQIRCREVHDWDVNIPIDVEYVVSNVENMNHPNMRSLEKAWLSEWEKKAAKYTIIAEKAAQSGNFRTAKDVYFFVTQCYYTCFLINFASIDKKKRIYNQYAYYYKKTMEYYESKVEYIEIALDNENTIPGYLHHPLKSGTEKSPCVVIYSGMGSCKEEMHNLARPLVDRGIAVFVPDMPGNGEAVFTYHVGCRIKNLDLAFVKILDFLETRQELKKGAFGVYGMCMGGGYAFKAASMDKRYSLCVNLFPLLVSQLDQAKTPQWMKQGDWYKVQTGNLPGHEFMMEMQHFESGNIQCPYLFVHGKHAGAFSQFLHCHRCVE
jgi:dienelactone hydrolase